MQQVGDLAGSSYWAEWFFTELFLTASSTLSVRSQGKSQIAPLQWHHIAHSPRLSPMACDSKYPYLWDAFNFRHVGLGFRKHWACPIWKPTCLGCLSLVSQIWRHGLESGQTGESFPLCARKCFSKVINGCIFSHKKAENTQWHGSSVYCVQPALSHSWCLFWVWKLKRPGEWEGKSGEIQRLSFFCFFLILS